MMRWRARFTVRRVACGYACCALALSCSGTVTVYDLPDAGAGGASFASAGHFSGAGAPNAAAGARLSAGAPSVGGSGTGGALSAGGDGSVAGAADFAGAAAAGDAGGAAGAVGMVGCVPCENGAQCVDDADCVSHACDSVSLRCVADPCRDHHQNGLETDADCGGGTCSPCKLDKGCALSSDCSSKACDGVSLQCVANQCLDHRRDGMESDVDCGGGDCKFCDVGKMCKSSFDCDLHCTLQPPHVCY